MAVWVLLAAGCRPGATPELGGGLAWLEVEVEGLAPDGGRVAFALFDSESAFASGEEPLRRGFREIDGEASRWKLEGLSAGSYAVKVYHDLDGDGVLDKNLLGAPTEPYGFSNDARGRLGPPPWARASFDLEPPGRRVRIRVF